MVQQDETKTITPKGISYQYSFEKYVKNYLSSFSIDDIEIFDLLANKSSKYSLYKFNDWIESFRGQRNLLFDIQEKQRTNSNILSL